MLQILIWGQAAVMFGLGYLCYLVGQLHPEAKKRNSGIFPLVLLVIGAIVIVLFANMQAAEVTKTFSKFPY